MPKQKKSEVESLWALVEIVLQNNTIKVMNTSLDRQGRARHYKCYYKTNLSKKVHDFLQYHHCKKAVYETKYT